MSVKAYPYSATSKFVASWGTGSRPSAVEVAAWDKANPNGLPGDRARFVRGSWQRHRKFFRTKEEAEEFRRSKEVELCNAYVRGLYLPGDAKAMAERCIEVLRPYGYTIEDATKHFVAHLEATRRSITVAALVDEYKAAKARTGKSARYLKDLAFRLGGFEAHFGAVRDGATIVRGGLVVEELRTVQIDDWLNGLGLAPQSVNNYRAVVHAFFEYAVKRDYAKTNPVSKIDKVKLIDKPAAIFRPDELAKLLGSADEATLPVLAIGAFAGLRMAEIFRLDWSEVNIERGFIEVKASKSKTAQRRLVKMMDNLRAWLLPFAGRVGPVWLGRAPGAHGSESNWRAAMMPIREAAGMAEWPENGLRHSFGSYHLAKFGDAARLALEMGHTTTKEIFAHYRELVRPEEADAYWQIMPAPAASNVVTMEGAAS